MLDDLCSPGRTLQADPIAVKITETSDRIERKSMGVAVKRVQRACGRNRAKPSLMELSARWGGEEVGQLCSYLVHIACIVYISSSKECFPWLDVPYPRSLDDE